VREIAAAAGVEDATPHRWRHTVATMALAETRDLRGVQEYLGHASLQSTQVYTGVVAARLQEIVESLPVQPVRSASCGVST
jgi:site-specific recombinase XerD